MTSDGKVGIYLTIVLTIVPLALHVLEKFFDRVEVLSKERIFSRIKDDDRIFLKQPFLDEKDLFPAVSAFFVFERSVHFILSTILFSFIVIFAALVEHFSLGFVFVMLCYTCVLLGFVCYFLWKLNNDELNPAIPDSVRRWRIASYILLFCSSGIVIGYHLSD